MCVCVCVWVCVIWQHFFVNINFIKHNRHFMSTYFLLDPFEFPYYFYRIWGELIFVLSIVVRIPRTFGPTLGHHQGMIYYKSDATFVLAYYHYVSAPLPLKIMAFAFKWISIISVSSSRHSSTLALVWKLILLSVGCMFLICSASRICSFCLLFYITFVIDPPLMMAQSRAESTRDTYNYGHT